MDSKQFNFSIADTSDGDALLTLPGGIGLYRKGVELSLALVEGSGLTARILFKDCFVRLGADGDAFIEQLIPGMQESESFDLGVQWDSRDGVSFLGRGALDITIPLRAKLPFVKLQALHISARPGDNGSSIAIELSADATASLLEVIDVTVSRIGVRSNIFLGGAPGPGVVAIGPSIGATADFKPPTGAGLTLNAAGIINGGGFVSIDPERGQYSGILSVNLMGIGATATVLIDTRPLFSLFAVLSADFRPIGLDVGFGFTINAIGGLLGLHRGVDLEALRDGVRTNAIASLMFPPNPLEDAPRILSDLERMFPVVEGQFLIGPMIQMGWGKPTGMVTLSIGLIMQLPDPNFSIPGVLKVLVPPGIEGAPLRLQVNFLGGVDFANQLVSLDASLYDSRLITYSLSGDMCARLRWGADASFAITVGGFHPRYVPAADLDIAPTRRISINLLPTDDNPRLRIDSYYAATSNTLQHGARIDAYAAVSEFSLRGFLGYDLLAQLSPLHFEADIGGAVGIFAGDDEIMGLTLNLHVAGPSPWHVHGEVEFDVFFISVDIPVDADFGSDDAPTVEAVAVEDIFLAQISDSHNWTATLPGQNQLLVQLAPKLEVAKDEILAHPSGTIQIDQQVVPLNLKLQRFGAAKPMKATLFDLAALKVGPLTLVSERLPGEFARAQFLELSNDEKMAAPAFEKMDSGLRASAEALVKFSKVTPRKYQYESRDIDSTARDGVPLLVRRINVSTERTADLLAGGSLAQSPLHRQRAARVASGDAVELRGSGYRVVNSDTLQPADGGAALANHAAGTQALEQLVQVNPALKGKLMVIAQQELE